MYRSIEAHENRDDHESHHEDATGELDVRAELVVGVRHSVRHEARDRGVQIRIGATRS